MEAVGSRTNSTSCAHIRSARVWGDGDPEGVRLRAAREMEDTARAAARLG